MKVYSIVEEQTHPEYLSIYTTINTYLYNQHAINDATKMNELALDGVVYWVKESDVLEREVY